MTNSTNKTDSGSDGDNGNGNNATLQSIIASGTITSETLTSTNQMVFNTLVRVGGTAGASINAIYVTESGSGDNSGSSWANAQRGTNLRTAINGINDASTSKVYVVLVGAGTYKATTGTDTSISFSMKNHTAIIGGFDATAGGVGSWTRSAGSVTTFDGELGTTADRTDNTERIFVHGSGIDHTAVLYGAEIRNGGNSVGTSSVRDYGAGMLNNGASPTLVGVTFISNNSRQGGGMYNNNSSLLIINSSFIANKAVGGGMFNANSSAIVVNTTFANNSNNGTTGGAIYNINSSTTFINVTMVGNSDDGGAGGVYDLHTIILPGSVVVNTVLWSNTAGGNPDQIFLVNDSANINITLAGTVLQGDTNDIGIGNRANPFNITDYGVVSNDANVGSLTGNRYMSIPTSSSAVNIGYHVKIDGRFANDNTATGATLYYSEDDTTWYTNITSSGLTGSATPPSSAVYLTKYDITGQERTGRPDAGSYEAR